MDSFHFSVALNAEIQLIHIEQKYNFYYPDSLSLIYIFCAAIKSEKHKLKWGGGGGVTAPLPFHRKTTKGQFRLQMIILHEGTGASFKTNALLAG